VYWSPSSRTALAEAELEYDDNHHCTAAFVKMPFVRLPSVLWQRLEMKALHSENVHALIWTTTPWTLPANQAIAFGAEMSYSVISLAHHQSNQEASSDVLVIARDRIDHVLSFLPEDTQMSVVIDSITGADLADTEAACLNPFQGTESALVTADFVTAGSGTGVVHMAPGHGMEDYQVCEKKRIGTALAPVDDDGRYTQEVFPNALSNNSLTGLDVQTEGAKKVLEMLSNPQEYFKGGPEIEANLLLATHDFTHKNPTDWRTKQPVIVRATPQWFADVSAIKDRALQSLEMVAFIPDGGETRLKNFVNGRNQWCISRQRAWGVPIPALYHSSTGEACIRPESINHIIETIKRKGTDAWFSDPVDDPSWIHPSLAEDAWIRGRDTMDVWFDSGTTWTTLSNVARPGKAASDVYLEGTDQHRGWFQSSLLTHIATQDADMGSKPKAPFRQLITHGFTLDGDGRKMSKSLGNVISPDQILDGSLLPPVKPRKAKGGKKNAQPTEDSGKQQAHYDAMGPDALRLWVASSDYTRDVSISVPVLQSIQQALQKYRVTFKFLLGVLRDYKEHTSLEELRKDLPFADRAVLHQLERTEDEVRKAYDDYRFNKAVGDINGFVNAHLSAFYFEVIKDAMYTGSKQVRVRTQAVLKAIFDGLLRMLGPITPHLIEEVWEHRPEGMKGQTHPLHQVWTELSADNANPQLESDLEVFAKLSAAVKLAQEEARVAGKLGSGLACKILISLPDDKTSPWTGRILQWHSDEELADLLVVSQLEVISGSEQPKPRGVDWSFEQPLVFSIAEPKGTVLVLPPDHHKCVRCWKYTAEEPDSPCKRCHDVLVEEGWTMPLP
jgi:isoleucyl-tRNA synthetase